MFPEENCYLEIKMILFNMDALWGNFNPTGNIESHFIIKIRMFLCEDTFLVKYDILEMLFSAQILEYFLRNMLHV